MGLDDIVKVTISASQLTPSKPGFGTILIAAQKVPAAFIARVRRFGSLKEMTDFGFTVSDPAYLCAQKCKAQDPSITSWLVGKRLNKGTQTVTLTCTSAIVGDTYSITLVNPSGVATTYTYTVPGGSPTTTTVATALAALIDPNASVAAVGAAAVITCTTSVAGELVNYKDWTDNIQFKDTTADPGLAADLAAIAASTNQDWYGLALDSQSEAEVNVAALFVESNQKIAAFNNSDWGCGDAATTTDVMSDLKTASYARSGVLWSKKELLSYSGPAWVADRFAGAKPGEDTWAYKTLNAVNGDSLTDSERSAIRAKNGNFYAPTSDINITERGTSGAGEWFDIVRFRDWLKAEIQFRLFSFLINNQKVPYTDLGVDAAGSVIKSALEAGVEAGGLEAGTISVTTPKVKDISSTVRGTRKLSGVKFGGKFAGAIHDLEIDGSLVA